MNPPTSAVVRENGKRNGYVVLDVNAVPVVFTLSYRHAVRCAEAINAGSWTGDAADYLGAR